MGKTSYRSFMRILEHWANHGVPQMLGTIISAIAICLGMSLWLSPGSYLADPTFRQTFAFATPMAWGTVYIVAAIAVLVMVHTNPRTAQAPVFMLAATFQLHGLLTIPQAVAGGTPSPIFMYIGMGWICLATQLVCMVSKEKHSDQATVDY